MPAGGNPKPKKGKQKVDADDAQAAAERYYTRHYSNERLAVRNLVRNAWLSTFVYSIIFVNTILIAVDDYYAEKDNTSWVVVVSVYADWVILALFTGEMGLKMVGLGLGYKPPIEDEVDPETAGYFADVWNRLDSFIVLMSWILVPVAAFSGADIDKLVRVLRLARPLRALREVKNLRILNELVQTVPLALASFVDVTAFLVFVLLVFSILALNIWGLEGKFHGRCVVETTSRTLALETNGLLQVPRTLCGAEGYMCSEGFVCSCAPSVNPDGTIEQRPYAYSNPVTGDRGCLIQGTARPWVEGLQSDEPVCPEAGYTCFNTFFLAMFTCFKAVTLESWAQIMWYAQDIGNPTIGWAFFVVLIAGVSFNIMNLFVASMSNAYVTIQQHNKEKDRIETIERGIKEAKQRMRKAKKQKKEQMVLEGGVHGSDSESGASSSSDSSDDSSDDEADVPRDRRGNVVKRKRSWAEIMLDPDTYWMEHEDHKKPLNPISSFLRKVTTFPGQVDECGTAVPVALMRMAQARNLRIRFGPRPGQFSLTAVRTHATDGATRNIMDAHGNKIMQHYAGGHMVVPQDPPSYATVPDRAEVKELLMQFRSFDDHDVSGVESRVDAGEPVPYLDMFILLCILINAASSCMEHFKGQAVDVLGYEEATSNCCDAECSIRSAERCPRSMVRMENTWYDFIFAIELIFNAIFTLEVFLKIISWWSFKKFLSHNYPSNLVDLVGI